MLNHKMLFSNYIIYFTISEKRVSTFLTCTNLFLFKNKAVKLIGKEHFSESTTQVYAKLNILKLLNYIYLIYINITLPLSFLPTYFNKSCDVSNRSTRGLLNPNQLYKLLYRTNTTKYEVSRRYNTELNL